MPRAHFTDANIDKLKPGDWYDPRYPNLYMRVGKMSRTWMYRPPRRPDGSRPGKKLGRFPELNKEAAVRKYDSEKGRLARGEPHPDAAERIRELEAELKALKRATRQLVTFGDLVAKFMTSYVPRTGKPLSALSRKNYILLLRKHAYPRWEHEDVQAIEDVEIEEILSGLKDDTPSTANTLHQVLNTLFNWGVKKKILTRNPCATVDRPAPVRKRQRHLFPDEIPVVWKAFSELNPVQGDALKLLLLTGQRRKEVAGTPWSEIHDEWWMLSGERTKNGKTNVLYLASLAQTILTRAKARPESQFVFRGSRKADAPVSVGLITHTCKEVSDKLLSRGDIKARFTTHDLRRTLATRARENGTSRRLVQTILNHSSKSVTDIYDLYEMKPEIREALTNWNDYLVDLLDLKPGAC